MTQNDSGDIGMTRRQAPRHAGPRNRRWSPAGATFATIVVAGFAAGSALAVNGPLSGSLSAHGTGTQGPGTALSLAPAITPATDSMSPTQEPTPTTPTTTVVTTAATTEAAPKTTTTTRTTRTSRRTTTRTTSRTTTSSSAASELTSREQGVLTLTNAHREENGCGPLKIDTRLIKAARGHAADMVERTFFDHVNPDGKSPSDRAQAAGFPSGVGENIAVGYTDAEAVMNGWMNSSGHRANILNCDYTVIGIGYAAGTVLPEYGPGAWVQVFGRT